MRHKLLAKWLNVSSDGNRASLASQASSSFLFFHFLQTNVVSPSELRSDFFPFPLSFLLHLCGYKDVSRDVIACAHGSYREATWNPHAGERSTWTWYETAVNLGSILHFALDATTFDWKRQFSWQRRYTNAIEKRCVSMSTVELFLSYKEKLHLRSSYILSSSIRILFPIFMLYIVKCE